MPSPCQLVIRYPAEPSGQMCPLAAAYLPAACLSSVVSGASTRRVEVAAVERLRLTTAQLHVSPCEYCIMRHLLQSTHKVPANGFRT